MNYLFKVCPLGRKEAQTLPINPFLLKNKILYFACLSTLDLMLLCVRYACVYPYVRAHWSIVAMRRPEVYFSYHPLLFSAFYFIFELQSLTERGVCSDSSTGTQWEWRSVYFCLPSAGVTNVHHHTWLLPGSGAWNLGFHACATSRLPTPPSPHPLKLIV